MPVVMETRVNRRVKLTTLRQLPKNDSLVKEQQSLKPKTERPKLSTLWTHARTSFFGLKESASLFFNFREYPRKALDDEGDARGCSVQR